MGASLDFSPKHSPPGTARKAFLRWFRGAPRAVGVNGEELIDIAYLVPDHSEPVWLPLAEVKVKY